MWVSTEHVETCRLKCATKNDYDIYLLSVCVSRRVCVGGGDLLVTDTVSGRVPPLLHKKSWARDMFSIFKTKNTSSSFNSIIKKYRLRKYYTVFFFYNCDYVQLLVNTIRKGKSNLYFLLNTSYHWWSWKQILHNFDISILQNTCTYKGLHKALQIYQ